MKMLLIRQNVFLWWKCSAVLAVILLCSLFQLVFVLVNLALKKSSHRSESSSGKFHIGISNSVSLSGFQCSVILLFVVLVLNITVKYLSVSIWKTLVYMPTSESHTLFTGCIYLDHFLILAAWLSATGRKNLGSLYYQCKL